MHLTINIPNGIEPLLRAEAAKRGTDVETVVQQSLQQNLFDSLTCEIHDRGRGPEIKGSRITVYDIVDRQRRNMQPEQIAQELFVTVEQVLQAFAYIDAHREEVMREYQAMNERGSRGNSPEIKAKLEASSEKFRAYVAQLRQPK